MTRSPSSTPATAATSPAAASSEAASPLVRVEFPAPAPASAAPASDLPGVALVTLERPEALNALSFALLDELATALEALDGDPACRAIVITGSGDRAFAAGADIRELEPQTSATLTEGGRFGAWDRIAAIGLPLIAAVRGFALGGGCELAMACDMIVAAEDASFGQPEIRLGVMPGAGGTQRLTRAIGKARAMELILTGRTMTAQEADAHGLVTRIVPPAATRRRGPRAGGQDRRHAAARRPCRQGGHPRRRGAQPRRWPRPGTGGILRALRHRRPGRGDGRLHPETPARLVGTLTPSARKKEDAWIESPRAGATSAATTSATSATRRPPRSATPRPTTSPRSTRRRRSAATPRRPSHATSPADAPEQDWVRRSRPPLSRRSARSGRRASPSTTIDREQLAAHSAQSHAQPLLDDGPAGLPVVYTIDAGAYDIVVNGDHLLSWGVEPSEIQDAALRNLAAWSATAPWTDEVSGERRLISSDTGDGWDAARILLPEVVDAPRRRSSARSAASSIGLPERHLLTAGSLRPGDDDFATLFADFIVEQSGGADEPIDRRVFELVDGRLVEFSGV